MSLKTDYVNDVLASSNDKRHFAVKNMNDDSVIYADVYLDELTSYAQEGDHFGAGDINATNEAVNDNADAITTMNTTNTFTVDSTAWVANSDSTTSGFTHVATIGTTLYADESEPLWDIISNVNASGIPNASELESANVIRRAYFTSANIKLYAVAKPTVTLKLRVKGL